MSESDQSRITGYHLVIETDPQKLQKTVKMALHNGWEPFGGLTVDRQDEKVTLVQPMVSYSQSSSS